MDVPHDTFSGHIVQYHRRVLIYKIFFEVACFAHLNFILPIHLFVKGYMKYYVRMSFAHIFTTGFFKELSNAR